METEPLQPSNVDPGPSYQYPQRPDPASTIPVGTPPQQPPSPEPSGGLRPSDPTRSGALWVGGAGVALLLAAAAVLTAVRWDDIGQSVKLGGLVAITAALLGAGQRFKNAIPMTAQAIFHLGALLIPFDMAAVAILAGRSWQETFLLTSVTSVVAWYSIERAVPSVVLRSAAGAGMVGAAAGVAAITGVAMAPALGLAAIGAMAVRRPVEAAAWALVAGLLPLGAFVTWPQRISGAMDDLGFRETDQLQPLIAGVLATVVLVVAARSLARASVAWSAVTTAMITVIVSLGGFADPEIIAVALGVLFLGLELAALATDRDPLWKPIMALLALITECLAGLGTVVFFTTGLLAAATDSLEILAGYGATAGLVALGWIVADRRRLEDAGDWLTAMVVGSDWPITTMMFPAAVLASVLSFAAPPAVVAFISLALAFWMVATWRTGSTYGALVLVALATAFGAQTGASVELMIGGAGAAMLSFAARQRVRANDDVAAIAAAVAAVLLWIVAADGLAQSQATDWPLLLAMTGAWLLSWALDVRTSSRAHVVHHIGRLSAGVLAVASLWLEPTIGLLTCVALLGLAGVDYLRTLRAGASAGSTALTVYGLVAGIAVGLAGAPGAAMLGFTPSAAGAVLAVASFVLVGMAMVAPGSVELPVGAAALTTAMTGLVLALGEPAMFAIALIAVGASAMFAALALRDALIGVAGYVVCGLGVSLQLAIWNVTWLEPYLIFPAIAALTVGYHFHRRGGSSWAAYAPTIALLAYVSIIERFNGGPAWHAVIAGAVAIAAIIAGGYRKLVGPLVTGTVALAIVVGYESLGPASLVPTWAWLATGGVILLAAGVALERSDTTPLERGQQIRSVVATQFS